jgi:hypothetical protein
MSNSNGINFHKDNFNKSKAALYFSPDPNKKQKFSNLYSEPRNIHQETDAFLSKNQIKQKITSMNKNILNVQAQNNLGKPTKLISEITDKVNQNKKNNQSYKKVNSKLYLKKNVFQNISSLYDPNGKALLTQTNFHSNININNISNEKINKLDKSRLSNIKFNMNQNMLSPNNSRIHLKKNAESAIELMESKTKNLDNFNNINKINFICTPGNKQNSFLSPQNHGSNPKIIFFSNEKNKTKDNFYHQNTAKDQNQKKENEPKKANGEENKKEQINLLLKNTFTNVKIFPTTILNNKIIYNNQSEKNNQNKNEEKSQDNTKNLNSINSINNSKIKKEKIVIETLDKKPTISKNETFNSIEELHYFYVDTLQKGKVISKDLDK